MLFSLFLSTLFLFFKAVDGEDEGDKAHVVALNAAGTVIVVGAPTSNGSGRNSGSVRVFQKQGSLSDWTQIGQTINGETVNDQSGTSVAINGHGMVGDEDGLVIAIGSPYHSAAAGQDTKSGHVRVWTYDVGGNEWTQMGSDVNIDSQVAWLGSSVSLSGDGLVLAAGAPYANGKGQVRVYQYAFNSWNLGGVIDGEGDEGKFGASIALSSDGTDLVVGDHSSSANGELSGAARVYKFVNNVVPGWSIELDGLATNFGGVQEDTPELVFTYSGERPSDEDGSATYRLSMLTSSCVLGESNDEAITPVNPTGSVPSTNEFTLTPQLDIDTAAITSSTYYFSSDDGTGKISFCLLVEIFVDEEMTASESADVKLDLDQSTGFEISSFETNRRPSVVRVSHEAQFNYTLDTFFCDENALDIGTDMREVFPNQEVSVCLATPNEEGAEVVDVQSVSFGNKFAPLLGVALIDSDGNPRQDTTVKECEDGKCRVAAKTVAQLYEYTDNDGNTVDVSQGVYMTGTVVYEFARRLNGKARSLELPERVKSKFSMKIRLARPPDRSSASPTSMSLTAASWVMSGVLLMLGWTA
jgi:hypothetical protein